jgi:hypothetical protein
MRIGESPEQHGRKVVVDHRHTVFRSSAKDLGKVVGESLADLVALVALIEAGPAFDRRHIAGLTEAFWKGLIGSAWHS